jgi:fructan beta-fructosidase
MRWASWFLVAAASLQAEGDLLIADFEGETYGEWKVEGEAFGAGPARGTLLDQMEVAGFLGKGLVNSFHKGDGTVGTLTSPPFRIRRKYINFLVGGGGYEGETCMNLLVGGKTVRTVAGPNTAPGGSEALDWASWDVTEFSGKDASIQIVDRRTGGWGHINVDHIVQGDQRKADPKAAGATEREILLDKAFLNLPIKTGAKKRRLELVVESRVVRASNVELAPGDPDFWAPMDVRPFAGMKAFLRVTGGGGRGLEAVETRESIRGGENLYREPLRPQFHFTQKRGWCNDPNGMVHYDGEWHLFYQHNPYGWKWENMHWGHAVSKDLVRWTELPIALYPWTQAKDHCFSGSAAVDWNNTAGFQTGKEKVIVAAFTDTGCGECIAFSNDRGRTFTYFEGNPVVKHAGRDPRIFWYAPGKHWVMAVYDEADKKRWIAFYASPDLKAWTFRSRIEGYFECPDIFEMPVDGDPGKSRWVILAADARYVVGRFDGKTFTPDHEGKHQVHWGKYYASQTFNDAPNGRRIQVGWGQIGMEGMPFNQMMTFPCELTLRTTEDGVRMLAQPVREIETLRGKKQEHRGETLRPGSMVDLGVSGDLLEIRAEFEPGAARAVGLAFGGRRVAYDAEKRVLEGMPLKPADGKVRMRLLVDRSSLEVFGNDGRVCLTAPFRLKGKMESVQAWSEGEDAKLLSLEVFELQSIW